MAQFDVQGGTAVGGSPVIVVRCTTCRAKSEHPMSSVCRGSEVSCIACGQRFLVTADNMAWIRSRASILGVPNQAPFVRRIRAAGSARSLSARVAEEDRVAARSRMLTQHCGLSYVTLGHCRLVDQSVRR